MARFKKDFDWSQIERDNQEAEEIIYVSKAELKRDAEQYFRFGESFVNLKPSQVDQLPFSTRLKDAILLAKTLKMEAKRRQINFIAKQLKASFELEDLQTYLTAQNPTQYSGDDALLDKQVRATIDRLSQPQFVEKTLELLAKQGFEQVEEAKECLASKDQKALYSVLFAFYKAKKVGEQA